MDWSRAIWSQTKDITSNCDGTDTVAKWSVLSLNITTGFALCLVDSYSYCPFRPSVQCPHLGWIELLWSRHHPDWKTGCICTSTFHFMTSVSVMYSPLFLQSVRGWFASNFTIRDSHDPSLLLAYSLRWCASSLFTAQSSSGLVLVLKYQYSSMQAIHMSSKLIVVSIASMTAKLCDNGVRQLLCAP